MTRKQRQSHPVHNDPRNLASFNALLDDDESEELQHQRGNKPPKQKASKGKQERPFFFQLRSESAEAAGRPSTSAPGPGTNSAAAPLRELQAMFAGRMDPKVVEDVFMGCSRNFPAALDALFAITGDDGVTTGASTSGSASVGQPPSASAATPSLAASDLSSPCHWGQLPGDVKQLVLQMLPPRELARLAQACREFAQRARTARAAVRHLALQPGLSYTATVGMVAGHTGAHTLSLARFAKQQRSTATLEEAEAALFTALVAAAQGYGGGSWRHQALRRLEARGLVGMTDRVLAEALRGLKHLRSLDLGGCESLSNKSLYALSKHTSEPWRGGAEGGSDSDDQGWQQDDEDGQWEEGWQALLAGGSGAAGDSGPTGSSEGSWGSAMQQGRGLQQPAGGLDAGAGPLTMHATAGPAASQAAGTPGQAAGTLVQAGGVGAGGGAGQGIAFGANRAIRRPVAASVEAMMQEQLSALTLAGITDAVPAAAAAGAGAAAADDDDVVDVDDDGGASRPAVPFHAATAAGPAGSTATGSTATGSTPGGGLQALVLSGSARYQDDGLRVLLSGPATRTSLASLDISRCGFSEAGLQLPPLGMLRELKASGCKGITSLALQLPASHPLASLDLSGCVYLRELTLAAPQLQTLNLSACRTLYRLRVRCPRLHTLLAPQCGALHSFYEDAWACPQLRTLNLFGCRRASGAQLGAVLRHMTALTSLNLNGCWELPQLHLDSNLLLQRLDVSGCNMLGSLSVSSPHLVDLQAASCTRLSQLSLETTQLQRLLLNNCARLREVHIGGPAVMQQEDGGGNGAIASGRRLHGHRLPAEVSLQGCIALPDEACTQLLALVQR